MLPENAQVENGPRPHRGAGMGADARNKFSMDKPATTSPEELRAFVQARVRLAESNPSLSDAERHEAIARLRALLP